MTNEEQEISQINHEVVEPDLRDRRDFLISLGKWSKAVIGGVVLGGALLPEHEATGQPRPDPLPPAVGVPPGGPGPDRPLPPGGPGPDRPPPGGPGADGPGWYNRRPGWYNRRPGWGNRSWYNRRPGWGNRGWNNRGWYNR